jgi:hypothetical protein
MVLVRQKLETIRAGLSQQKYVGSFIGLIHLLNKLYVCNSMCVMVGNTNRTILEV